MVEAWKSIVEDEAKRRDYQQVRGLGGFVDRSWDEVNGDRRSAANVHTIKNMALNRLLADPGDVDDQLRCRFAISEPDPEGRVPSFYDWYCDLPHP